MPIYLTQPIGPFSTAAGASFGTFTTRRDISPVPMPIFAPNLLTVGARIKIEAEGEYSTTGTPTLSVGIYTGAPGAGIPSALTTVLGDSVATAPGVAATAFPWRLEWRGLVTTVGTSGQMLGQGDVEFGTSLTAFSSLAIPQTAAERTITWDTTAAKQFGVCATYSVSSASNTVKVNNLSLSILTGY